MWSGVKSSVALHGVSSCFFYLLSMFMALEGRDVYWYSTLKIALKS